MTESTPTGPIAVNAASVAPRTKPSNYPEPFFSRMARREKRQLGDVFGLKNFGVNLTRIAPGGQSSCRHAHSKQDEFVYVLEGEIVVETNAGRQVLRPGMCAGFPAGTGDAHRFVNETARDAVFIVVGDRTAGDEVEYPDDDLKGVYGPEGRFRFLRKNGTPY